MLRWAAITGVLVGCGRGVVCDPAQVPIADRQGFADATERLRIANLLTKFEKWSGHSVCLSEVEIVSDLESQNGDLSGRWISGTRRIQIDHPGGLSEATVFHELCHAIDTDHDISGRNAQLFDPAAITDSKHYDTDRAKRREHFARRCEIGPVGPVVELLERRCGDPTTAWIEREIWSGPSTDAALRLAEPPVDKYAVRHVLDSADWHAVSPHVIERDVHVESLDAWQAEIRFLDDEVQFVGPPKFLPWEVQLAHSSWRTLPSEDQVMWAPIDGVPWLLAPDELALQTELPSGSWRGSRIGDRWWVHSPERPLEEGLNEVDLRGVVVARHELPSRSLGPIVGIDGDVWIQDLARHDNHVRDLDGDEVLTLPRDIQIHAQRSELLLARYEYTVDYKGAKLKQFATENKGLAWLDEAGVVYIESPCDDWDELDGRTAAPRTTLDRDRDAETTEVLDVLRSYPIE